MSTTAETPTIPQLQANLVAAKIQHLHDLREDIKLLKQEESELTRELLDQLPVGTTRIGDLKVSVRPGNQRIDPALFAAGMPVRENPDLYELKPKSLSQVKELIGLRGVEPYIVRGNPVITIKEDA